MTEKASDEIIAKCMENIVSNRQLKLAMNIIYKVNNVYEKRVFFFIEPLNERCNAIFDKLNKSNDKVNSLTEGETQFLKEMYPNQNFISDLTKIVKTSKTYEIVKFFIRGNDSILDIKRKIMLHTDLYYNNIHLWANVKVTNNKVSKKLQNTYLSIEKMESGEEFKEDFSTFQYNPMFNYLNVQTMMSLGIYYEVNNGLILVNPDPRKVIDKMPLCNIISSMEESIHNYTINNNEIFMIDYNTYLDRFPTETLKNLNVLKYFFPNIETDDNFIRENIPLVNSRSLRTIGLDSLSNVNLLEEENPNIKIGYECLNNIVIQVNRPANFFRRETIINEIDLLRIFENYVLDDICPFIRYRDSDGKYYNRIDYKSLENVYKGADIVSIYEKYDLNDTNYVEEFFPALKGSKIGRKDLDLWTTNLQSYRERQQHSIEKNLVDTIETKGIEEIILKIKMDNSNPSMGESSIFNDNYMSLIIKKNGHLIIKFLNNKGDIPIDSLLCIHLEKISDIITELNKLTSVSIPMFIPNLRNPTESTNIEFTTLDSNIENITSDLPITFKNIKDNYKNLISNFYGFDISKDLNELKMLFKSVDNFQSYNNIRNHFLLMRETVRNRDKFLEKWIVDCDLLFGLSVLESTRIFEKISEELEASGSIKIGRYDDLYIEVELKRFTDKLFSLKIMNCNSLALLSEIKKEVTKFLTNCAMSNVKKPKPAKTARVASPEPVPEPKIQVSTTVIPQKTKTFTEVEEFSDSEVDEFDEFDDDELDEEAEPNNGDNEPEPEPEPEVEPGASEEVAAPEPDEEPEEVNNNVYSGEKEKRETEALRTYAPKIRKFLDSQLFDYKRTSENEQYSRLCGAVDNRQPIILTPQQWNHFERINPEAFNDIENMYLRWGSDKYHMNYYICPRIFCFHTRCMFPLTAEQLIENDGVCFNCGSGIMNESIITNKKTILIRRGGSNKYWSETVKTPEFIQKIKDKYPEKWNEYLEFTEKVGIPGFIDPKSHPNNLCMPCCFSGLNVTNIFKNVDKCIHHHVDYYVKIIEANLEKVPELIASFVSTLKVGETIRVNDTDYTLKIGEQILISGNSQFMGVFQINEKTAIPVKKFTVRELTRLLPNTLFIIDKDSYKSWSAVKYTEENELVQQRSLTDDSRYIITWNRRPIPSRRLGKLPILLDRIFKNNLERDIKKGYLIPGLRSIVLREGVNNNNKNSFICAVINKYILNGTNLTLTDFLKVYIEDLKLEEFLEVNNGDLVQQFAPNIENIELRNELVEKNFDLFIKFSEKHKSLFKTPSTVQARKYKREDLLEDLDNSNPNKNKKITKKNKKIREIFLVFHAFEFFKKYLGDQNIYKDYKLLWNLFAIKCPISNELDKEEMKRGNIKKILKTEKTNILILELDDGNDFVKLLTPMYSDSLSREYEYLTVLLKFKDTFTGDEYFEPLHFDFRDTDDTDGNGHLKFSMFNLENELLPEHLRVLFKTLLETCIQNSVKFDVPKYKLSDALLLGSAETDARADFIRNELREKLVDDSFKYELSKFFNNVVGKSRLIKLIFDILETEELETDDKGDVIIIIIMKIIKLLKFPAETLELDECETDFSYNFYKLESIEPLEFSGKIETEKYSRECEKANSKFIEIYLEEQAFKLTDFIIRSEFQREQILYGLVENPLEAKLTPNTIIPDDEFEQFKNDFFSRHKNIFSSIRYPYILTEELFDSPGEVIDIQDKFLYRQAEVDAAPEPAPARPKVKIMKKKDYSEAEQYFDGPFNDYILKKQITTSKEGKPKYGNDKLKMMTRCLEEDECKGITLTSSKKKWSLRKAETGKLEPSAGEGPSYVKKTSGIKPEDDGEGAAVNVPREESKPESKTKTKPKVTIMKKKTKDYSGVEEQFAGPVKNHILKKQITTSKEGKPKSGTDKLEMMSRCLEEDECKGLTLTSSKKWSLRKAETGKLEQSDGEGPSYVKKTSGIDIPVSSGAASVVTAAADNNNSHSASTKAMNNKPLLKLKHVKHLSSKDIDKMSLDELKFHYYIEKDHFIEGSKKIQKHFNFKSNKENNYEFEKALRECLKEEICNGVTEKPFRKKMKYEMRDGVTLKENKGEKSFVKHTKKSIMRPSSMFKSKKLELGK